MSSLGRGRFANVATSRFAANEGNLSYYMNKRLLCCSPPTPAADVPPPVEGVCARTLSRSIRECTQHMLSQSLRERTRAHIIIDQESIRGVHSLNDRESGTRSQALGLVRERTLIHSLDQRERVYAHTLPRSMRECTHHTLNDRESMTMRPEL